MWDNFKLNLLKNIYSIVGFKTILKLKNNRRLVLFTNEYKDGSMLSKTYKYINNKEFIVNIKAIDNKTGVTFFKQYTTNLSYWTIGALIKNKTVIIEYIDFLTEI